MPRPSKQDTQLLEAALIGFQQMRQEIEQKISDLRVRVGGDNTSAAHADSNTGGARTKRRMSASARRRIALAQKKRWAAFKAGDKTAPKAHAKKRALSAAGRARIIAATKKRWAAFHKAQKTA